MIGYQGSVEWVALWMLVVALALVSCSVETRNRVFIGLVITLVLTAFVGLRVNVGTDYGGYLLRFLQLERSGSLPGSLFEPGFVLLMRLSIWSDIGFHGLMFLSAALAFAPLVYTLSRYSPHLWLAIVTLFGLGFIGASTNPIRQAIAISFCLFAFRFIWHRSLVKYVISVCVGALFHATALIMLPFYWLAAWQIPRSLLFLALLFSAQSFFIDGSRDILYPAISFFSQPLGLSHYVDRVWQDAPRLNSGLRIFTYLIMAGVLILYYKKIWSISTLQLKVSLNLFIFGLLASITFSTFWALPRLSMYFMISGVLLFPLLARLVSRGTERTAVICLAACYWSVLFFHQILFAPGHLIPYQSLVWPALSSPH